MKFLFTTHMVFDVADAKDAWDLQMLIDQANRNHIAEAGEDAEHLTYVGSTMQELEP